MWQLAAKVAGGALHTPVMQSELRSISVLRTISAWNQA